MRPDQLRRLEEVERKLSGFDVFSDRIVFRKNIEFQRGRHTSAVYAGAVTLDGDAGTPFPAGWSVVKDATGKYTVTHNLNRTDYIVLATFVDDNAGDLAGVALTVTKAADSFSVFSESSLADINHDFHFAVLI